MSVNTFGAQSSLEGRLIKTVNINSQEGEDTIQLYLSSTVAKSRFPFPL